MALISKIQHTWRKFGKDKNALTCLQGCGSGSGLDPDSNWSVDPDPGGENDPQKYVLKCWLASFES
jgi:hypothetical protein